MIKKCRRILSAILAALILLTQVANAGFNISVYKDTDFNYLKYVTGFNDGTFRPDSAVTRAECAKMLSFIIDIDSEAKGKSFRDVPSDFWAYSAISKLAFGGLLKGYADGTFRPDNPLTRAEFAVILMHLVTTGEGGSAFPDIAGHWAKEGIIKLASSGILAGYPDGTFKPNNYLTRAEAVATINRIVNMKVDRTEKRRLFSDLDNTHWAYYEVMAAVSTTALESSVEHGDINFNDISYIELNAEQIDKKLNDLILEFPSAEATRQGEIFNEISMLESDVALAISMSTINSQRDVTSKKDSLNLNNSYACSNSVSNAKNKRYELLSVVKDKEVFEKTIGMSIDQIPKPELETPEKLIALLTEEQGYENEFDAFMYENSIMYNGKRYSLSQAELSDDPKLYNLALDYYVVHKKEYGEIFDKLVNVRTRIAHYFGYRYYTDLGYILSGKYFYAPEDVDVIRDDVKKYIAPLYYKLLAAASGYENGYYALDFSNETIFSSNALDKIKEYMRELSPQTREAFDYMNKHQMFDTKTRENKTQIAFTTYIDEYNAPFVFMNEEGTVSDIETFSHEFGHAFQMFRVGNISLLSSKDVAEIASHGMETLIINNYQEFFGNNASEIIMRYFFYTLQTILISTFMDEYQYNIYNDIFLTIEERNELYESLYNEYFIGIKKSHKAFTDGIHRINPTHIYKMPYYSIDYTFALTAALQLWELGQSEGFDKQFETYITLLESRYIGTGINILMNSAGMRSPFSKGIIESIAIRIDNMFKLNP